VTGRIVKCQVKSSAHVEFHNGETSVPVRVSTYNLWRATPLITVLFHVDTQSRGIYWTPALAHHPRPGAQSLSVRFEEASDLTAGIDTLRDYLNSWFAVRGGDAILQEIPLFYPMYQQLVEDVDGYDDWTDLPEPEDKKFRLFYQHALRVRLEAGLTNEGLPTLDECSRNLFPDNRRFHSASPRELPNAAASRHENVIDDWRHALGVSTDQGEPIVAGPNRGRATSKFVEVARPD